MPRSPPRSRTSRRRSLLDALATLTAEQREAFLLREITGLSYDEIAAADGLDRRVRADAAVPRAADAPRRARPAARVRRAPPADDAVLPLESFSLTPRAAGAVGAAVVAVSVSASVPAGLAPRPRARLRRVSSPSVRLPRRRRSRRRSPPRGRNRRRHGRLFLRSDAPRRRLRSLSPSSLRARRRRCRPDSSARAGGTATRAQARTGARRVRHRRRCPGVAGGACGVASAARGVAGGACALGPAALGARAGRRATARGGRRGGRRLGRRPAAASAASRPGAARTVTRGEAERVTLPPDCP